MIEQTLQELTPIVGTRPACGALRASAATIYRPGRPPQPRAQAAAGAGQGSLGRRTRDAAATAALGQVRRQLAGACLGDAARRRPLPGLGTDDVPAPRGLSRWGAGAARPAQPPRLHQAGVARRTPERGLVVGHLEAQRPGQVDVLSPVRDPRRVQPLRGLLDRAATRTRGARQSPDRPGRRAAADRAWPTDPDRGTAMSSKPVAFLLADLGVTKTHSQPYTATDNPKERSALQDAQVPARVPPPFRLDRARQSVLPPVLRLVQPPAQPLRDRPDDPGSRPPRPSDTTPCRPTKRPRRRLRRLPRTLLRQPPAWYLERSYPERWSRRVIATEREGSVPFLVQLDNLARAMGVDEDD